MVWNYFFINLDYFPISFEIYIKRELMALFPLIENWDILLYPRKFKEPLQGTWLTFINRTNRSSAYSMVGLWNISTQCLQYDWAQVFPDYNECSADILFIDLLISKSHDPSCIIHLWLYFILYAILKYLFTELHRNAIPNLTRKLDKYDMFID